jgi:threonine 3-dehydrogenase
VDAVIDITGAASALHSAFRCVRAAGKVVSVGLPGKPIELDLTNEIAYREVVYTGVSGRKLWETWEDFSRVMSGPYFKPEYVMGGRYALEDFDRAVEDAKNGVPGKKLIYPHAEDIR